MSMPYENEIYALQIRFPRRSFLKTGSYIPRVLNMSGNLDGKSGFSILNTMSKTPEPGYNNGVSFLKFVQRQRRVRFSRCIDGPA
jgi:hypothetical protein